MTALPAGTRVKLRYDEDRYPHFIAPKGTTGIVVDLGASNINLAVRMDETVPGAEEWDNEVHWFDLEDFNPYDAVEVLSYDEDDEDEYWTGDDPTGHRISV